MFKSLNSKAYYVGGCVRDHYFGIAAKDIDYSIECTREEFEAVFPDAECVGADFPVYLIDGNEVALTRTERSTGESHQEFAIEAGVSIVDDLKRRDFTINSIAINYQTGEVVDPFNGKMDICHKILRSLNTTAFTDDAVRIYRGLRFLSRFALTLDADTRNAMRSAKRSLVTVKAERIEKELKKMYAESPQPSAFFEALLELDLLDVHFAPLAALALVPAGPHEHHGDNTAFQHTMEVIDRCKADGCSFDVFVACLCHDFGKGTTDPAILPHHYGHENRSADIAQDWLLENRFSGYTVALTLCVARNHMRMQILDKMKPSKRIRFIRSVREHYRDDLLCACNCDHRLGERAYIWGDLRNSLINTKIDLDAIKHLSGDALKQRIENVYISAYKHYIS